MTLRTSAGHLGIALVSLSICFIALAPTAPAANIWDGGGTTDNWNDPLNWDDNLVPVFPSPLTFTGTTRLTPNNNIANPTVLGMTFVDVPSPAGAFVIGGNGITLGNTLLSNQSSGGIINSSASVQTVNLPLTLTTDKHYFATDVGAGDLILNGAITRQVGATAAFDVNGGQIKTTLVNDATGIIGGWAVATNKTTSTGSWASADGSGNIVQFTNFSHNFAAADSVPTNFTSASNVRFAMDGNLALPAGTQMNTLLLAQNTTTRTITLGGSLTLSDGGGIYRVAETTAATQHVITGGSITAGNGVSPATIYLRTRTTPALPAPPGENPPESLNINSLILDNGAAPVAIVKTGYGVMRLGANSQGDPNGYSGGTYVLEGQLRPVNNGALGRGPVHVLAGAEVLTNGSFSNDFFLAGVGPVETFGAGGALRLQQGGNTISGKVTLTNDARIGSRSINVAPTADGGMFTGQITGNFNLELNSNVETGPTTITGNGSNITLNNTANPANDWGGNTTIGIGRVRLGANEQIPHGPGKGNVIVNGTSATALSILDLRGRTETINGLLSTGTVAGTRVASTVEGSLLRVGGNNASSSFGGVMDGSLNLEKIGTGTLTLTGDSTHTGATTVTGGVLALSTAGTNNILNSNIVVGPAGQLDVTAAAGGFSPGATQTLTNNGTVTGPVALTVGGIANGVGNYAGGVNVQMGTFSGGPTGGTGTVTASTLTAANTGTLLFEVGGANADRINVTGAATMTGAQLTMSLIAVPTQTTYTVMSVGSFSGVPTLANNAVGRTSFALNQVGNELRVTLTGAPAALRWDNAAPATGDGATWDNQINQNWRNGATADRFFEADTVTFNDQNNAHYTVNVGATVKPLGMTVDNSAGDYVFNGSEIGGTGALTKSGTRALTLNNANTFSGGVTLNQGTLNFGAAGGPGASSIGTGRLTINGGALDNTAGGDLTVTTNNPQTWAANFAFTGSSNLNLGTGGVTLNSSPTVTVAANALTVGGTISDGTGNSLTKAGTGALVLAGSNLYTGTTTIAAGTLRVANSAALGPATGGAVNVQSGGSLDVGAFAVANDANFGQKQINIAGPGVVIEGTAFGALTNSHPTLQQQNAFQKVTLTADASVGSPSTVVNQGRFDIRGGGSTLDLAGNTLTKIGASQFTLVGATMSAGDVVVNEGIFATETTTVIQAANKPNSTPYSMTFNEGTTFQLFNTQGGTNITRRINVNGNVKLTNAQTGSTSTIGSPIVFTAPNSVLTVDTSASNNNGPIVLLGAISGTGSLVKKNNAPEAVLTLSGDNSYNGTTTVGAGTLRLGASDRIPDGSNMTLGDNLLFAPVTFHTGGFSETLGTLSLLAPATIDMGNGASTLRFASSSAAPWNFNALTVANWTPGNDHLFFGSSAAGLDAVNQLAFITFAGKQPGARILTTGEVLPTLSTLRGDFDQSGIVDVADIPAMLLALTNLTNFKNGLGLTDQQLRDLGDYSGDNFVGNTDIQGLLTALGGGAGGLAAVPEPSSIALLALGACGLLAARARRRTRAA